MSLDTEIEQLFARYLTAWNARDFEAVAACYTFPCLFILPQVSMPISSTADMISLLEGLFAGLEAGGFSHTEINSISARACGDGLAIVNATDVKRLRKDGSVLEVIDAHYVVRFENGVWRFATAVSCDPGWRSK